MLKKLPINHRAHRGFTLAEALVYIAVLVTITTVLMAFLLWAIRVNTKVKVEQEILDNARRAMETMAYEIKEAKSIYSPTSRLDAINGQLSLETTHNPPSGETSAYLDFYLCGNQLCLKKEETTPIALTSDKVTVDKLSFSRLTAGAAETVQINLSLKYNNPVERPEWQSSTTLISTITLRGY